MIETEKFEDIPPGFYLCRMFHESQGKHVLHLSVKVEGAVWYDCPQVPAYSESAGWQEAFRDWALASLPVWNYPKPIKRTIA